MLWGFENSDMTFVEAVRRNDPRDWTVNKGERKAVELLFELVDHERASRYLVTGEIYARGNITGTTFKVQRCAPKVLEYDSHGRICASWCVHADGGNYFTPLSDGARLPRTDEMITLKNLIEGEESRFRLIGNRTAIEARGDLLFYGRGGFGRYDALAGMESTPDYKLRGVVDPYAVDFMGGMMPMICEERAVELVAKGMAQNPANFGGNLGGLGNYLELGFTTNMHPDNQRFAANLAALRAPRHRRRNHDPRAFWAYRKIGKDGLFAPIDEVGGRAMCGWDVKAAAVIHPKNLEAFEEDMADDELEEAEALRARERVEPNILSGEIVKAGRIPPENH